MIDILVRVLGAKHRRNITFLLAAVVGCILAGGAAFAAVYSGGMPITTGWYWAITTASTVGYGDVTPNNAAGRVIASLVMLTTIPLLAAVFALLTGRAAAEGLRRIMAMADHVPDTGFRLVVGTNPMMPAILDELVRAKTPVVLVADVDPATIEHDIHIVRGDPTHETALRRARPADAAQALVTGASDGDVLISAVLLRKLAPDLPVTALVSSPGVRQALRDLGIRQTLSGHALVAGTLAMSLEAPHAAAMMANLVESGAHRLTEVEPGPAAGKALSAVRSERGGLVLGLVHDGRFTLGLGHDPVVGLDDRLLVAQDDPARRERSRATLER